MIIIRSFFDKKDSFLNRMNLFFIDCTGKLYIFLLSNRFDKAWVANKISLRFYN
jgi:hypothetical protein